MEQYDEQDRKLAGMISDAMNEKAKDMLGTEAVEELEELAKEVAASDWFGIQVVSFIAAFISMPTENMLSCLLCNAIAQGRFVERHGIPTKGE